AWEELWGVTLDQLADYNILHDPQLEAKGVSPYIHRAFAGEAVTIPAVEYDPAQTLPGLARHEDSRRWVAAVAYPLKDRQGRVREVVLIHQDISERKRAEEALRVSEERFRTFVDHAADGFFLHEQETARVLDVNRRACESLGYTRDELIGMTPFDFDADVTIALIEGRIRKLFSGEMIAFESRHRRKDGTVFPVEIRGKAFWEGGRGFIVSLVRDMTERKRAEEALRESEERFRGTFENAAVGIAHEDLAGRFLRFNKRFCAILGYESEELVGKTLPDVTHPEDLADDLAKFGALTRGETSSYTMEKRFFRKDGAAIW